MVSAKVIAETGPASEICKVMIPGWPVEPQVVARTDGKDVITVEAVRCHSGEVWHLVRLRQGKVIVRSYRVSTLKGKLGRAANNAARAASGSPARVQRTDWSLTILVPPAQLETIQVDRQRPRPHRPDHERAQ